MQCPPRGRTGSGRGSNGSRLGQVGHLTGGSRRSLEPDGAMTTASIKAIPTRVVNDNRDVGISCGDSY